ncbi:MAG TPA: Holliday junction branch migration protein RuvA [Stellaceae bacterium]|nr:Holliday junction branch migration protein RuvA [Stellaceae bacterium]
MIALLSGVIDHVASDQLVLDVNGVGYLVYCSGRTLARAPRAGEPMRLLIETHVREDHIHLFGFADEMERDWFRLLLTVQGVGGRLALAVLSALAPDALATAIMAQDKAMLARADGVGQKLAQRIANELKDKVAGLSLGPAAAAPAGADNPAAADAVSALVNLGYQRSEAFGAVGAASQRLGPRAALDALIRAGLRELQR